MRSSFLICQPHWCPCILFYRRRPADTGAHCSKRHFPRLRNSCLLIAFWSTTVIRVHLYCLLMLHRMVSEQSCLILFLMAPRSPLRMLPVHLPQRSVKYSQIDKEALCTIFGVTKFRRYLLGRHFTIQSDHKPLIYLCNHNKAIPATALSRTQRWSLIFSAYDYSIAYRPGKFNANAHLPLPTVTTDIDVPVETVLLFECLQISPLSAQDVASCTRCDPILPKVHHFVLTGWPTQLKGEGEYRPYFQRQFELSPHQG